MSETPPPPPPSGGPDQPPYGQPPHGAHTNPQVPYGAPQPTYWPVPPDHPKATTVLILGIVGIVVCGLAAPFAWVMGNQVIREIDASGGALGGRANANVGRILGIVVTALMAAVLVLGLLGLVVFIATAPAG